MGAIRLAIVSRWLVLLAGVVALGGCATDVGPSEAELKARWEAQNIFPAGYKSDLLAFLRTYLNNPSQIRDAAVSVPQLKDSGPGPRYIGCVRFNARAADGTYQGSKEGAVIFVSGKLDRFLDRTRDVREFCKDINYAPFPELETLKR